MKVEFLRWIHRHLLLLFPKNYREEFGEELQAVFRLSIEDAARKGGFEVERLVLRELISLPKAILSEHMRERRKAAMLGSSASRFDFIPGSRNEVLAALAPFLFFGALPTLLSYFRIFGFVPLWLDITFTIVFWLCALGLLAIGFVKRLPRWFMPYIGIPLPFFSYLLFISLMEKFQGVWWYSLPWFLREFLQQGLLWIGMFLLVIILLVSTRLIPASRPFHQRLRNDWTLLSFLLYGATPLSLMLTLNDYKNQEPYMFLALLVLAAGGRSYLRNDEPLTKFLCLNLGVTFSMLIAAIGKAVLVESSFPGVLADTRLTEFMSTGVTWMWLALLLLIPPLLNLFPKPDLQIQPAPDR